MTILCHVHHEMNLHMMLSSDLKPVHVSKTDVKSTYMQINTLVSVTNGWIVLTNYLVLEWNPTHWSTNQIKHVSTLLKMWYCVLIACTDQLYISWLITSPSSSTTHVSWWHMYIVCLCEIESCHNTLCHYSPWYTPSLTCFRNWLDLFIGNLATKFISLKQAPALL